MRDAQPYLVRHQAGFTAYEHTSHTLFQEMTVFVPPSPSTGCADARFGYSSGPPVSAASSRTSRSEI